jgi:hypothetical protein
MSIFTENSTVGRLLNQEWDSHRQAKHMAKQLEKTNEAKERAAQERARAEAEAEAKFESAKKDVIKYRTQFYDIINKIETVFDATDDEFYMRDTLNEAWSDYLHAYKRGEVQLLTADQQNALAPLYRIAKEVTRNESTHEAFREAFRQAIADDLFALPTVAEMIAIREEEARIQTEKNEVARIEALRLKEEKKAERKANSSKHPLHWFKQLIAWATLIGGSGTTFIAFFGSYLQYAEGQETGGVGFLVICFVIFTIPALLAVKALWFREYNKLVRAAKKA